MERRYEVGDARRKSRWMSCKARADVVARWLDEIEAGREGILKFYVAIHRL